MFVATHSAAGMFLGAVLPHPAAAFAAGVVSHFILDMVPHEHEDDLVLIYPTDKPLDPIAVRRRKITSWIDVLCTLIIVLAGWFVGSGIENRQEMITGMAFGIAGGVAPDCIIVLIFVLDNSFMRWYFDIHNRVHFIISRVSVPRKVSVAYQLVFAAVLLYLTRRILT